MLLPILSLHIDVVFFVFNTKAHPITIPKRKDWYSMSYSCDFSFKALKADEIMPFLLTFKKACTKHLKEIADCEYWRFPFHNFCNKDQLKELSIENRESARLWAHNNVFKFKYFYNSELQQLGMSGVYKPLRNLFDGTVHFQNSTDQDYSKELWGGITQFETIYDKWMGYPDNTIKAWYMRKTNMHFDEMIKNDYPHYIGNEVKIKELLDYYRRTHCYDEIWFHFERYLFDDENNIFLSVYGNAERKEIMQFINYCYDVKIHNDMI
jgi:hypothetical protein